MTVSTPAEGAIDGVGVAEVALDQFEAGAPLGVRGIAFQRLEAGPGVEHQVEDADVGGPSWRRWGVRRLPT
jgi:hypothetical protein